MKYVAIGLGECGSNIVSEFYRLRKEDVVTTIAVDCDRRVRDKKVDIHLVIGEHKTKGLGAGGDSELGTDILRENMNRIEEYVKNADVVMTFAGLGRGMGSSITALNEFIAEKYPDALLLSWVTLPFRTEPKMIIDVARERLEELNTLTDNLFVTSNNLLKERIEAKSLEQVLREGNAHIARCLLGFINIFEGDGDDLIRIDFPTMLKLVKNSGYSYIGYAERASIKEAYDEAIKNNFCDPEIKGCKSLILHIYTPKRMLNIEDAENFVEDVKSENSTDLYWGVKESWRLHSIHLLILASKVKLGAGGGL
ncbi:MAG TPA: hypothetical protein ENF41_02665 [Candidatus Bathyarchaeota archaeon]|nr:hypothetical protein [Candidatus Bathyarchaeota archaeon]